MRLDTEISPSPSNAHTPALSHFAGQPEFFQAMIEATSDIMAVVDEQGILCYQTPSVKAILGYEPHEGLGESAFQHIHPDDLKPLLAWVQNRFALGAVSARAERIEIRIQHKNGTWRTLAVTSSTLVQLAHKPYLVATAHDISRQAAVAIENSRLLADYKQTLAREQQLNAVTRLLNSSLDLPTVLREVMRLSIHTLRAQGGVVSLIEPDGQYLRMVYAQDLPTDVFMPLLPRGRGIAWEAVETQRSVWVRNYPAHPLARPAMVEAGVKQMVAVPMLKGTQCIGVLQLVLHQFERQVNQQEIDLLEAMANQATVAVENARLFNEVQRHADEVNALYRASGALFTTTNLKLLGQQIAQAAIEELDQTYCVLLLLDEDATTLYPLVENSPVEAHFLAKSIKLTDTSLVTEAAKQRTMIYARDVAADPRYLAVNTWTRSELVLPLQVGDNLLGVLNLESRHPHAFNEQRQRILLAFAERAALALQNALLFQQIEQAANYTTLLNEMTQAALQAKSFDHLTQTLAERLQGLLNADGSALMIVEPNTRQVRHRAVSASIRAEYLQYRQMGQPLLLDQLVLNAGGTLILEDIQASGLIDPAFSEVFQVQALAAVGLKIEGHPTGFATIVFRQPRRFGALEIAQVQQAGREISLAVAHRSLLQKMDEARQMAEDANRLKTEFLANTSHELRTPLSGIIGALELARDETHSASADGRIFVDAAYQAAQNLVRVIDDLMDIAKIEAGKLHIDLQPTPIALVLQEVVNLSRALAERKNLRLELFLPNETLPFVYADADRTRQILLNVVGNAIKFTAEGGVTITLYREPTRRALSVCVRDTGIGIPPDQQERLFQPFVQADGSTSRRYGGTGLGLSISRRLAELMNGSLTLRSEGLDQGSAFTLTLPLA